MNCYDNNLVMKARVKAEILMMSNETASKDIAVMLNSLADRISAHCDEQEADMEYQKDLRKALAKKDKKIEKLKKKLKEAADE